VIALIAPGAVAERRLVDRLLRASAFTVATAVPLADLRMVEQRRLARLRRIGVILQTASGAFYLDGPALANRFRQRRRQAAVAIIVVLLIAAAILLLPR
jgi:hypothetical protein